MEIFYFFLSITYVHRITIDLRLNYKDLPPGILRENSGTITKLLKIETTTTLQNPNWRR